MYAGSANATGVNSRAAGCRSRSVYSVAPGMPLVSGLPSRYGITITPRSVGRREAIERIDGRQSILLPL